jgi:Ca2+-binding EF-hand superfamily protein
MQVTDSQITAYIDQAFQKYDKDRSGYLDVNELAQFFN